MNTFHLTNMNINNIAAAHEEMMKRIYEGCKQALKEDGFDLDVEVRNWCSFRLDVESVPGDGPFIVQQWLHDERAKPQLIKEHEVARNRVVVS